MKSYCMLKMNYSMKKEKERKEKRRKKNHALSEIYLYLGIFVEWDPCPS